MLNGLGAYGDGDLGGGIVVSWAKWVGEKAGDPWSRAMRSEG